MSLFRFISLISVVAIFVFLAHGQTFSGTYKSQEISDEDGIPVLIKHLPNWEFVRDNSTLTNSISDLRTILGDRPVLSAIDLSGGSEAVTANYPAGRLLIVEFSTPQASTSTDASVNAILDGDPVSAATTVYRRIGNYNAFVFDARDRQGAAELLDQIRYQKKVQWLGDDPYLVKRIERYLVGSSADMLIATALFITLCLFGSVVAGVLLGYAIFRVRDQRRAAMHAYSDAGGLTRLNLDELSE